MRTLLTFLITLIFSACKPVGTDYSRPTSTLPDSFSIPGGRTPLRARWWENLNDAQLNVLVQRALADNLDIKLAEARFHQARAIQGVQETAPWPVVALNGKIVEDHISKNSEMLANIPSKNITTQFTNYQLGFDASWEIDLFGRLQRLSEAALTKTNAEQQRIQDVSLVIAAESARYYIDYRLWQQRLNLAKATLPYYDELLRLARLVRNVGEGTQLDVQRAELNRADFIAKLPDLETGKRNSLAALSVLTGTPPTQLETELRRNRPLPPVPEAPASGLPSDLLNHRPDVRAAERDLAAANAEIGAAIGDLYPRFALLGNAGWVSIHSGSLLNSASQAWSIGPTVTLPLFNKRRLQLQVKVKEAAFDAALALYQKSLLSALADVEVALTRVSRSEEKRLNLLDATQQQQKLLSLTEWQLYNGKKTQMAVLDAKRLLAQQEDQQLQAHAQSLTALTALFKALGGDFNRM